MEYKRFGNTVVVRMDKGEEIVEQVKQVALKENIKLAHPGGMPVGTNGKSMLLLSGGIDSPVAGYMIAKRGVKIDAVYFKTEFFIGLWLD